MAVALDAALVSAGNVNGATSLTLAKATAGTDRAAVIAVAQQNATWVTIAYGTGGLATPWAKAVSSYGTILGVLVNPPTASTNVVTTFGVATIGRVIISSYNGVSAVPVRQKKVDAPSAVTTGNANCVLPAAMLSTSIGVDSVGGFDTSDGWNPTFMTPTGTELNKNFAGSAPSVVWGGSQYLQGTGSNTTLTWFFNATFTEIEHAAIELKQTDSEIYPIPRITAVGSFVSGAGGSLFPTLPAHLTDDILVMVVETANQAIPSWPAGWTEFTNSPQGTGTAGAIGGVRISAAWHRCTSASETAPQLVAGTMNHTAARIFGVRGCITTGNPFDVTAGGVQASATNSFNMPSVTTTTANCLIAYMGAFDQDNAAANQIVMGTVPSGLDSGWDKIVDSFTTTGTGGGLGVMYGAKKAAGATGTANILIVALTGTAAYLTVAFKPVPSTVNYTIVIQSLTSGVPALVPGAVTGDHIIVVASLTAAAPTLASGAVTLLYAIDVQSLTTGVPAFAPGTVSQLHTINVNALATAPPVLAAGAATGNYVVAAQSLTTALPTLATGTVTQRHVVVVANLTTSAPVLAAGVVTQLQVIAAQNLATAVPVLVPGTITQRHVIVTASLATAVPTLVSGTVTQRQTIVAQSLTTAAPTLAAGAVTQRHVAAVSSLTTSLPALAAGAVTQRHVVLAASLTAGAPVLATGAVTQRHQLVLVAKTVGALSLQALTVSQRHIAVLTGKTVGALSLQTLAASQRHTAVLTGKTVGGQVLPLLTITQRHTVILAGKSVGSPSLPILATGQKHVVPAVALIVGAPALAAGPVTQRHTITLLGKTVGTPTVGLLTITQRHVAVVASLITTAPTLVSGAVTQSATFAGSTLTTAAPVFVTGTVTQAHVVVVSSLTSAAPTLASGAVTQRHTIVVAGLTTAAPTLVVGAVGSATTILPNPLTTAAPVFVTGTVTQRHVAVVAALATAAPTLASGAISQQHAIATTPLATAAPILATGAVTQRHVIVAASLVTGVPSLPATVIVVSFYLRPESDISAGGWTDQTGGTTGLYAAVADKSAANFIKSSNNPAVPDIVVLKAESPPLVEMTQPVVVAYEYGKQVANGTRIDITARLMQGTTEIAAWTHTDVSSTLNVAQQTLTGPQFVAITDTYALRFVLEATAP